MIDESAEQERAGVVGLGCTVKVRDLDLEEEATYAIVGSQEANPMESRISDDSPFGRCPCLASTSARPSRSKLPVGTIRFEILSVER